jgi:hypothetical protein
LTEPSGFIPPKLALTGNWDLDIETLYKQFSVDFKASCPRYGGRAVIHDRRQKDGKEIAFWHLVTRGDHRDYAGTPDYDRAERLPWVRALIEHPDEPGVRRFKYREGSGVVRTYIWYEAGGFAVVLEPLSRGAMRLITAFYIQSDMRRQEMRNKYAARVQ